MQAFKEVKSSNITRDTQTSPYGGTSHSQLYDGGDCSDFTEGQNSLKCGSLCLWLHPEEIVRVTHQQTPACTFVHTQLQGT